MTVAEFPTQNADPGPANRVPPQDIAAEQSVLGAMLLSKDAIADVVETIRQDDFYRPAHQSVFGAITDLFTRGEPADAVTIANTLSRAGELERIGGAVYLHTLVAGVPTAANAGYYAQIVRERSILRKLVTAGTRIVQLGYDGEGDVDKVVDSAQSEVFEVTSNRASEDYLPLAEIMDDAVTEIEGIASRSGEMVGVPTGFIDLDRLTNGLHPGQLIILAARPAIGKALALDTPLPTPGGWTTMGQVQVGDQVVGVDGRALSVVAATEIMNDHECYLMEFSDGSSIVADADHQWVTEYEGTSDVHTSRELSMIAATPEELAQHVLPKVSTDNSRRYVAAVTKVPSVPVRCIEVDSDDHLFLAGRSRVPTHNSTLGLDIARSASLKHGLTSVIFSLEMSRNEIVMRLLSAEAQIPLQNMRSGKMNDPEWRKIAARQGAMHEAPLFVDDSPNMTMTEIRAKCRRLKQRNDLRLVVVDYMQLMQSGKKVESRQQEVSEFSRSMKLLAKELDVPVIAISQLNRGPEARNDKKPMLSDLRESGSLEQDADMVLLIHREDAYDKESSRVGEADFIVAKHRNGPTDTITVSFQGHYSRFVDMARE